MDADTESKLEALQRLYKFLNSDGDGVSNNMLDGNARLVFKNLLDAATQKSLKAHAELIAARSESPTHVFPSHMLQRNSSSKEQPVPQQTITTDSDDSESFVTASDGSESYGTDPGFDQKINLEQSFIQSVGVSGPEYLKKRCRVCKRSTIKKLESINSTEYSPWKSGHEPGPVTDIGRIIDSLSKDEIPNKPKETDSLSKEASEAIKAIQLCISALQLGADHQYQHKDVVPGTNSENPCKRTQPVALFHGESSQSNVSKDQRTHEVISEENCFPYDRLSSCNLAQHINDTSHLTTQQFTRNIDQTWGSSMAGELREPIEERPIEYVNQNHGHKVKSIIDKMEPRKWITSNKNNNFMVRESPDKSPMVALNNKRSGHVTFSHHKHSNSSEMKLMTTNGNILDLKTRGTKRSASNCRAKNREYESERESTASCSSYSSNSNYQQDSGDSEEYSLPRRTHRIRSATPSTSTNSAASRSSYETEGTYGSSTSNSEDDEAYSSTGNRAREISSSTDSEPEGYSTDKQSISSRNYKSAKGINRTKTQSGTWKKLKNGLNIIFHHHHHHKDHYKGKPFLSRRKAEACGEKAVEKMMKKSVAHDKKRHNHFHGIMEAVLRHVHHSKKSISGDKIVPLDKVRHGNKKLSQKSQWWKVLQHHRQGKLHSKATLKIGVGKNKHRLKALPTIKLT